MPQKKGLSYEIVEEAILESRGVLVNAARKLGVSRNTVYYYVRNYKTCEQALQRARQQLVDELENQLLVQCARGNVTALKYALSNWGRDRGWSEKVDVGQAPNEATQVQIEYADDNHAS